MTKIAWTHHARQRLVERPDEPIPTSAIDVELHEAIERNRFSRKPPSWATRTGAPIPRDVEKRYVRMRISGRQAVAVVSISELPQKLVVISIVLRLNGSPKRGTTTDQKQHPGRKFATRSQRRRKAS